jgi:lipopolysaccharide export system permease protein
MAARRWLLSPVSSRYLFREFLGLLVPILLAFMIIYLLVDFFDRLDILLKNQATLASAARYFMFKVPLIVTQIIPPATLAAMLLSLGVLSQRNEIIAWRASGVSLLQTAQPLLGVAALISVGTLAWNETVVPYCTREYQYINNVEIRKRAQRGILSDREIWYHGVDGFYNIQHIDPRRRVLLGLTIYRTDTTFNLRSIIEVPAAQWKDNGWDSTGATERTVDPTGEIVIRQIPPTEPIIRETLNDFLEVHREPAELSYRALRAHLRGLSRKGIDTSNYLVDLHLKLAVPFTTLVLAWVAIPLAGRVQRHPSVAGIVGSGLVIGFGYWVVLALTNALGQSGALPPMVSAWAANAIFVLLGCGLFLSGE